MSSQPPTAKQLAYLRALAERTGQTFATPRTSRDASDEIRRLKAAPNESGLERRIERDEIADAIAAGPQDSVRVIPSEVTGYGSTRPGGGDRTVTPQARVGCVVPHLESTLRIPRRSGMFALDLIFAVVQVPIRISISTCVGCGSMREFATCETVCREHRLEMVTGGVYDELVTEATASRSRIQALLPIVTELAEAPPRRGDWSVPYESLRGRARRLLSAAVPPARETSAETTTVWRCPDCGGLEETQPCIGVCIWRPVDWVQLGAFESERGKALKDIEFERALFALVTRFALVRPREGEWERNWLAFQAGARLVLRH